MKQTIFAAMIAAATLTTACTNEAADNGKTEQTEGKARVRLAVGGIEVQTTPMISRGALTANGKALTDLFILDYDKASGELLQILHQTSAAADFAAPELSLTYGAHTLKAVATRSESPTLLTGAFAAYTVAANTLTAAAADAPLYLTSDKTSDTFAGQTDITVTTGAGQSATLFLDRLVAKLVIKATDTAPADIAAADITLTEYPRVAWQDFSVTGGEKNHRTADITAWQGKSGNTLTYFVLCPTDGYTTDMTFTLTAADGTAYEPVTLSSVPFERNKVTTISGGLFGHSASAAVSVADAWSTDTHDINL